MVLLVPDDSEDVTEEVSDTSDESGQPKAQLDDSEASRATQKVDLDLDDAPFLEDEDEEEEEEIQAVEEEVPLMEEEESDEGFDFKALLKNKMVLSGLGVILLLIVVIIILLLREPEEAPPPPPPPVEEITPDKPAEVVLPEILIRLDPFLVEQTDKENRIRFLEIRLIVSTTDEGLSRQFKQETYTVRNALYYYLKNKDLQFLTDKKNGDRLKKELLAIINQYMGFGQFETVFFEQYLVR